MILNDFTFSTATAAAGKLCDEMQRCIPAVDKFTLQCAAFIEEFLNDTPCVSVLTSGSTGSPKVMLAEKSRMRASARMTCKFLSLKPGDRALLCMPLEHIAGKMMVVRALQAGLKLYTVSPCTDPFAHAPKDLDFAAITPMQAHCVLQNAHSTAAMSRCRQIIIGGGFILPELAQQLGRLSCAVYHSYGMTETLSHIALRRIDSAHPDAPFYPLPGVKLSLNTEGTLCIDAPQVAAVPVQTNDLAAISDDGSFVILGRRDNVINSGGIKLLPESIEKKLSQVITTPFALSARRSIRYGEELVLVSEIPLPDKLLQQAYTLLDRYEKPKAVLTAVLPRTATQKIDRPRLKSLIAEMHMLNYDPKL